MLGEMNSSTRPTAVLTPSADRPRDRAGNAVPESDVAAIFDQIAPVYDRLNTVLSLGFDRRWRSAAAGAAGLEPGDAVIDVAAGTGKLAATLADRVGPFGRVVAVDISQGMVERGAAATGDLVQVEWLVGNALALPADDDRFDAATIAFGMRNLADFAAGFRELRRVVRPGGRVVCLELTNPRPRWWGRLHAGAFRRLAPIAGSLAGRRRAYTYLPESLEGFPDAEALATVMREAGLTAIHHRPLGWGAVALHVGVVPRR
jgi:demethylmenaquinone methyltransferase / 2-methoxy-6-polyprenyl-1,4-benzoquinol methylase